MSFFTQVTAFATVYTKQQAIAANKDPLVNAKQKFNKVALEQITLVSSGQSKGFWFVKQGDNYIITLKNGAKTLNKDQPAFSVQGQANAIKFIQQAQAAAQAGEFDQLFVSTVRKPRKQQAQEAAAAAAPAQAPAAPAAPEVQPTPAAKKAAKK